MEDYKMALIHKYSNEILSLIEDAEKLDHSDLEGVAMAIVLNVINEVKSRDTVK